MTRVLVTHDLEHGLAEADRVLALRDGYVVTDAPADQVAAADLRTVYSGSRVKAVATILRKDLLVELRTKESVPSMALFATTTFVIFHFGLDRDRLEGELAAGVLWVTLLFAAILGINRLFVAEREQGGFDGILMAPIERTSLLIAKAGALFVYLVALGADRAADLRPVLPRRRILGGPAPAAGGGRSWPTSASPWWEPCWPRSPSTRGRGTCSCPCCCSR